MPERYNVSPALKEHMADKPKIKLNFKYPKKGTRIKLPGSGFNPDRFGNYVTQNSHGDLIIDMNADGQNHLPDDLKFEIIHPWDNFEVL